MKYVKKTLIYIAIINAFLFSNSSIAENTKGVWKFIKDPDYCLIESRPIKTEIPEGKKRGDNYIYVYRINNDPNAVIQITAGYNYKQNTPVKVKIDKSEYEFYTHQDVPDSAWTEKDNEVIFAMKKGLELTIIGVSSRGTKTVDTYTLKGFTSAYNKLTEDC